LQSREGRRDDRACLAHGLSPLARGRSEQFPGTHPASTDGDSGQWHTVHRGTSPFLNPGRNRTPTVGTTAGRHVSPQF
jgi:hypothetical protein